MNRTLATLGTATAVLLALGFGTAQATTGRDFGDHVSTCERTMGLHADHNPGTHTGYADWDGHACHH
jgi:hypothetical protein